MSNRLRLQDVNDDVTALDALFGQLKRRVDDQALALDAYSARSGINGIQELGIAHERVLRARKNEAKLNPRDYIEKEAAARKVWEDELADEFVVNVADFIRKYKMTEEDAKKQALELFKANKKVKESLHKLEYPDITTANNKVSKANFSINY